MSVLRVKQEPPTSSSGGAGASIGYRYQHAAAHHSHQQQVPATCYVCGAPGTDYRLHTRARDKGSYFPFLENHDIADGAQRPGSDGVVAACVVCYSFLTQQWEAFERSRTPLAKRLYWLKRNDTNTETYHHHHSQSDFPPANANTPVTPNTPHRRSDSGSKITSRHEEDSRGGTGSNCLPPGGSLVDEESHDSMSSLPVLDLRSSREADRRHRSQQQQQQQHSRSSGSGRSSRGGENAVAREYREAPAAGTACASNGALDLSMPDKNAVTEVCYLCSLEAPKGSLMNIYAKPIANCPFFPSLTLHPRASGSRPMDSSGRVQACGACHQHLLQQWDGFQRLNVHHSERHYRLRKSAKVPSSAQRPPPIPQSSPSSSKFLCFLCGSETPTCQQRQLLSACHPNHPEEPYFPFLEKMRPPKGVPALSSSGRALVCPTCHCAVLAQHQQLGSSRPQQPSGFGSATPQLGNGVPARERDTNDDYDSCNCYTCGVLCPMSHTVSLASVPSPACPMFFPFLRDISPPVGVRPVDEAGCALVCRACASSLRHQWEAFECERVPHSHRRYVLYAQPPAGPDTQLRIEVPPEDANPRGAAAQASLLTTVTSTRAETPPQQPQHQAHHQGASSSSSSTSAALDLSGGRGGSSGISVPAAVVCYVCGARTLADDTYTVRSFPKPGDEVSAFFPFLTLHAAPPGAESMTDDGTVPVCIFCYHTLMSQWSAPEASHRNPWQRAYDFHDYVCYVCGVTTYRKRVKAITVLDFPFLVEHPRPADALVLREGASVAVCLMCYDTLNAQWSDFERMKVPVELRKYNWIAAPPPPEVDDDAERQRSQQQHHPYHHRSQHAMQSQRTFSRSSRPSPSAHSPVNGEMSSDRQSIVVTDEECDQQPQSRGMVPAPSKPPAPHQPPQGLGLLPIVPKACRSSQISPESSVINHHSHGHGHHQHPYNHQQQQQQQQQHSARNASFAAALRKLAIKQATDPVSDHDAPCGSPGPISSCPSSQQPSKRASAPSQPPPPLLVSGSMTTPGSDSSPYKICERSSREHSERDVDRERDADEATRDGLKYLAYQSQSHREREEAHAHYPHIRGSSRHEEHTPPATGFQPYRSSGRESQGSTPADSHLHHRHQQQPQHQHPVHHPHVRSHSLNHHHHQNSSLTHTSHRHPTAMTPGGYDHVAHAAATAAAAAAVVAAATATYPYQPTFLTTAHLPPPHGYRYVDPMYLLRPPQMLHMPPAQHPSTGLMPPHFAYAPELMTSSQPVGLVSPADAAAALVHERVKIEEQQRRDRERERMLSPQQRHHHHHHHLQQDQQQSSHHGDRRGSIVHGTPRDAIQQKSPSNSRMSAEHESGSYSNSNSNHHQHRSRPSSPQQQQQHRHHTAREGATSPWQHPRVSSHRQSVEEIPPEARHFWDIPTSGFSHTTPVPTTVTENTLLNPAFTPTTSPFPGDAIIVSADDPCSPAFGRLSKMTLGGGLGSHRSLGAFGAYHAPPTTSPPPLLKNKTEPPTSPDVQVNVVGSEEDGLVSRLDVEEKRRKERRTLARARKESAGADGEEDLMDDGEDEEDEGDGDDSESEDERRWSRLVTVYSGPPLPLDENPPKMRFLGRLGLTSRRRRKELELKRLMSRRRRFRERSLSPIDSRPSPPRLEAIVTAKSSTLTDTQPEAQNLLQKKEFLGRLGLEPVNGARRQDLGAIWSAITDERRRRNGFRDQGEKRKLHVTASDTTLANVCKRVGVGIADSILLHSKRSSANVKNGEKITRQVPRLLQSPSIMSSKKTDRSGCPEAGLPKDADQHEVSRDNRLCCDNNQNYRWPGIEVLMEAYERYRQEHQLEREVLLEQCGRLRNQHGELSSVADSLSRQMSDLIETKKLLDEERQRRQCAIDHLKLCLKSMR